MRVLVFVEHEGGLLTEASRRAVSAAARLGEPVDIALAGGQEMGAGPVDEGVGSVNRAWLLAGESYASQLPEPLAERLAELVRAEGYGSVVAATSSQSRDLFPRLAAALDVQMVTDAITIEDPETFVRPLYGGSVLARIRCPEPVKVVTVRATRFPLPETGGPAHVERLAPGRDPGLATLLEEQRNASQRPDLASARVVVAGGRGVTGAGVEALEALADRLGAAIGASRGAVEAGLLPHDAQVGLTAKVVAPDLYIAAGISGAIYHVSGMKDSRVIVAINQDEEAPIFEVADYGLVADLADALPRLCELLEPS